MSDENKAIAKRIIERAWTEGDMGAVDECLSMDCRLHDAAFPGLAPGAESFKRHIGMCRKAFPDLTVSIEDVIAERDEVVIHWNARGTHEADFLGMAPTHRPAAASGTSIFRIQDRKIIEYWSDWNLLGLMQQLGITTIPKMEERVRHGDHF